ncbi:hypothetical protein G7043_46545 [Lentzea sp. NEAU-D13]|uniref:Phage integrase family protein n=1 Tax=Lentzea alba TaxID=2714351 RepID=A0A7C9VX61_9PSEU|nr:hypothetical protein [Lentzea alba]NGY66373.1 hypothetical protein [Lentzea alba]
MDQRSTSARLFQHDSRDHRQSALDDPHDAATASNANASGATPTEILRIAEQAAALDDDIAGLLIITAAWTGCRWGEPTGLRRDNIDLDRSVLIIDPRTGALHESAHTRWLGSPKTASSARTITLPPFLITMLRNHFDRHDNEFVFTAEGGTWLWRSTLHSTGTQTRGQRQRRTPSIRRPHGADPARTDASRVAAQPQDMADLRRRPEIAQARRLGHPLPNRVTGGLSHIAPEVELRLLNDLQYR